MINIYIYVHIWSYLGISNSMMHNVPILSEYSHHAPFISPGYLYYFIVIDMHQIACYPKSISIYIPLEGIHRFKL